MEIPTWSYNNLGQYLLIDSQGRNQITKEIEIESYSFMSFYNDLFRGGLLEELYNLLYI